jgi:hypothetical protein
MLTAHFQVTFLMTFENPRNLEKALAEIPDFSDEAFTEGVPVPIGGFPMSAKDHYRKSMERILRNKREDLPVRILSWIFYAVRPLKMHELQDALAIEKEQKQFVERYRTIPSAIVKSCQGLIDYDDTTQSVKFVHDTVKEFLQAHHISDLHPPSELAKTCLYYIGLDEFNEPCLTQEDLSLRLDKLKFTKYACEHWAHHARGDPETTVEIQKLTFSTLRTAKKLQSLTQINQYRDLRMFNVAPQTIVFHILALNGLAMLCQVLLDQQMADIGQ